MPTEHESSARFFCYGAHTGIDAMRNPCNAQRHGRPLDVHRAAKQHHDEHPDHHVVFFKSLRTDWKPPRPTPKEDP